jgi:hypothetical protein
MANICIRYGKFSHLTKCGNDTYGYLIRNKEEDLLKELMDKGLNIELCDDPKNIKSEANDIKIQLVTYSEKSFALIGNTYPIKEDIEERKGKYSSKLIIGNGYIWTIKNIELMRKYLRENNIPYIETSYIQVKKEEIKKIEPIPVKKVEDCVIDIPNDSSDEN